MRRRRPWRSCAIAATLHLVVPGVAGAQGTDVAYVSLDSLLSVPVHAAARYAQSLADAPASVSVVTAAEIEAFGMRTLADVLAAVPGFYLSDDRNYTYIGVRGFSRPSDYNNRVLLLLNGQVINETVYGTGFAGTELPLDLSIIERVEVVRGPVSALYGTNAMLAVVNIVTSTAATSAVTVEGGALATMRGAARWSGAVAGGSLLVSGLAGTSAGNDYDFPELGDGTPGSGAVRGFDGDRFAGMFARFVSGSFRTQARAASRHKELPTGAWSSVPSLGAATRDQILEADAGYDHRLTPTLQLGLRSGAQYYDYRGWYPDAEKMWEDASTGVRLDGSVQLLWDMAPANRVVAGVTASRSPRADYQMYVDGAPDFAFDRPFTGMGAFLQNELHVAPWLSVTLGGRIDRETDRGTHATPRAAVVARPSLRSTVKLIYGEAFRSPNAFEDGVDDADYKKVGTLNAERIRTTELVLEQRLSSDLMLRTTVFDMKIYDLIDLVVDDEDGLFYYTNEAAADLNGIEGELTAATGAWLVQAGGVLQSARDHGNSARMVNAPVAVGQVGASGPLLHGVRVGARLRAESGRVTHAGAVTAPWMRLDLNARAELGGGFSLAGRAHNLLDARIVVPGGVEHPQDMLPQSRRALFIQVERHW